VDPIVAARRRPTTPGLSPSRPGTTIRLMPESPPETAESKSDGPGVEAARYQPLVIVLVAACAGIVADRLLGLPLVVWWPATLIAWLVWLIFRRLAGSDGRGRAAFGGRFLRGGLASLPLEPVRRRRPGYLRPGRCPAGLRGSNRGDGTAASARARVQPDAHYADRRSQPAGSGGDPAPRRRPLASRLRPRPAERRRPPAGRPCRRPAADLRSTDRAPGGPQPRRVRLRRPA